MKDAMKVSGTNKKPGRPRNAVAPAILAVPEAVVADVPVFADISAVALRAAEQTTTDVIAPAETTIPTPAALLVAPAPTKEASTMVEQFNAAAQTAFTQGSDKARETLDKTVRSMEDAGSFAKGNVEALMASGKAATAGAETITQNVVEFSKKSFEAGSAHMQTLASTRTPADAFKLQSDFAKTQFDGMVAEMSRSTETMMKIMGEVFEPLSNRAALAAEKIKTSVAVAR